MITSGGVPQVRIRDFPRDIVWRRADAAEEWVDDLRVLENE
jgi:hypothetical protein